MKRRVFLNFISYINLRIAPFNRILSSLIISCFISHLFLARPLASKLFNIDTVKPCFLHSSLTVLTGIPHVACVWSSYSHGRALANEFLLVGRVGYQAPTAQRRQEGCFGRQRRDLAARRTDLSRLPALTVIVQPAITSEQRDLAMHGSGVVRILYLTYDGLTSLIGQSQVWPYLKGLAAAGHQFDVISFEHEDRCKRIGEAVARDVAGSAINWHPCSFRSRPPILAKLLDQREMVATAGRVAASGRFDAVHARSYVAADAALRLKRRFGLPFIFDMRGFWVDERREGGRWRQSNPLYRRIYRQWKARERAFTAQSDHIVVLTKAAKSVVEGWDDYRGQPVTVIPCCIDHVAFALRASEPRKVARARLGIDQAATVLVYLGSVGTNYLLKEMLRFFSRLRLARPGSKFLFIGWLERAEVFAAARAESIDIAGDDILIQPSEHGEVSFWLAACDIAIALRRPSFSSLGASPTKLGEYLACGLPVVVNDGVGDVREIVEQLDAGAVLSSMSDREMDQVVSRLDDILAIDAADLRERSRKIHDLPVALASYRQVYDSIAALSPGPVV